MNVSKKHLEKYLSIKFNQKTEIIKLEQLGSGVLGTAYKINFKQDGANKSMIMKSLFTKNLGKDHFSDRAQSLLLAHDSYNAMENHVKSLDVVSLNKNSSISSMGESEEFFIIMEEAYGTDFFNDLKKMQNQEALDDSDKKRIKLLAENLAKLHNNKQESKELYQRKIRDTIGSGESIMGVFDTYPDDFYNNYEEKILKIIQKTIPYWSKARMMHERLREIHGDYHPGNLWFDNNGKLTILDRSRGRFGEPADDLAAFLINLIFFSVAKNETFTGTMKEAFQLFLQTYLDKTKDYEIMKIIPPYFAFRTAVVCNPIFYPDSFFKTEQDAKRTRESMLKLAEKTLTLEEFNPEKINNYMN